MMAGIIRLLLAQRRSVAGTMAMIRTVVPRGPQSERRGMSWSRSVALRLSQRSVSDVAEETSSPGTQGQGLQLSDSCVKVESFFSLQIIIHRIHKIEVANYDCASQVII